MIWVLFAGLILALLGIVVPPLIRRDAATPPEEASALSVYRDQLSEVDKEAERGLISPAEADAARAEIKRRVLAVAKVAAPTTAGAPRTMLAGVIAVGLIAFSLVIYFAIGRPALPDKPFDPKVARATEQKQIVDQVDAMVVKLAAHLKADPNDAKGWRMLGWTYLQLGRVPEGVSALKQAVALDPKDASLRSQYGEAIVRAADGKVTPDALQAFEETLAVDPKDARARFYRGLALVQAGKEKEALALWAQVIRDGPKDAEWIAPMREQATALALKLKLDPKTAVP